MATVKIGGCCNCGGGSGASGSTPPDYGTPTLRAVDCTYCENTVDPPYDCASTGPISVPEVWRFQFRTVRHHPDPCGCDMPGQDSRLIDVYLVMTFLGASGYACGTDACAAWNACYVQTCPRCGGWCYSSGSPVEPGTAPPSPPTDLTDGMEMYILPWCGTDYDLSNAFAPCDVTPGSVYTVTEPLVVIRLWVEDFIEEAYWVTPLAGFNWSGANTFDLVLDCTIGDCCLGTADPILSLPSSLTIYPSATPACVAGYIP